MRTSALHPRDAAAAHSQRDGVAYEWVHADVYHFDDGKIAEVRWTPFDQTTVAALLA